MARLKIFQNGQFQSQRDLDPHRGFLVGRGETCDLVLSPERGISRQHFRIRYADGQWIVEVLSRFGELYRNGEKQTIFQARDGMTFTVPPYEFVFENEGEGLQEQSVSGSFGGYTDGDKTHIGYLPSQAFLRLNDHRGQLLQSYRLEGQAWIGGRDTSCSIFIDNPRISRKQFEIQKQDDNYFIRDLGSINVTLLNSRPLSSEEWTALSSSDLITVGDWSLQFELRDAHFEQRLQEIDPAFLMPASYQHGSQPQSDFAMRFEEENLGSASAQHFGANAVGASAPVQKPGMKLFGRHIPGLNPVRLALVVIILLAVGYSVFNGGSEAPPEIAKMQTPFDKLPQDKQQIVKQLYVTAQSLLAQGRYELARQEIIKLHQIIPFYEDSKQIEETANQGLAMLQEREKAEAEERQKAMIEDKIQRQVAQCRAQMRPESTLTWAEDCLSSVMEFNPEHPLIVGLKNEIERINNERLMKQQLEKEYNLKVAQLRGLYVKAQKIEKKDPPLAAIGAYSKVVKSTLPDPGGLQGKAKRQIASIQSSMLEKQLEAEQKADAAYRAGQLREAIVIVRKGLVINPDNEILKGRSAQYLGELRKQMMVYYQEAILEESVGEVESAKSRWKKIMELSLSGEDYYEKAKMKLKKYGAL